jgi:hypothetical protein
MTISELFGGHRQLPPQCFVELEAQREMLALHDFRFYPCWTEREKRTGFVIGYQIWEKYLAGEFAEAAKLARKRRSKLNRELYKKNDRPELRMK